MTEYYKGKLEAGLEYQDFIADELRKDGIILGAYSSRKWQNERGESMSGIEVKHDMLFSKTGNLYFEVSEKSNPDLANYTASGIMRDDNTWLYLIGDYNEAFLFAKVQLKRLYEKRQSWSARGIQEKTTPTSRGFTIPVKTVLRNCTCIRHFRFNNIQQLYSAMRVDNQTYNRKVEGMYE